MSLENLVAGDYGYAIELTVKQDAVAVDISGFDTVMYLFKAPNNAVKSRTGAFKTTGADGVVTYTVASGDIDARGLWSVQVALSVAGAVSTTVALEFDVQKALE